MPLNQPPIGQFPSTLSYWMNCCNENCTRKPTPPPQKKTKLTSKVNGISHCNIDANNYSISVDVHELHLINNSTLWSWHFLLPLFHMPSVFMQQIFKNKNSIRKVTRQLLLFELSGKQTFSTGIKQTSLCQMVYLLQQQTSNLQPYFMVSYDRSSKKIKSIIFSFFSSTFTRIIS